MGFLEFLAIVVILIAGLLEQTKGGNIRKVLCSVSRCQPCHLLVVRCLPILALLPDAVHMFTDGWGNLRLTIPPLNYTPLRRFPQACSSTRSE